MFYSPARHIASVRCRFSQADYGFALIAEPQTAFGQRIDNPFVSLYERRSFRDLFSRDAQRSVCRAPRRGAAKRKSAVLFYRVRDPCPIA
jgi:hypothetical protein